MKHIIFVFALFLAFSCKKSDCSDIVFTNANGTPLPKDIGIISVSHKYQYVDIVNNDCVSHTLRDYTIGDHQNPTSYKISKSKLDPGERLKLSNLNFQIDSINEVIYLKKDKKTISELRYN